MNLSPLALIILCCYCLVAVMGIVVAWRLRLYPGTVFKAFFHVGLAVGIGGRILSEQVSTNPWSLAALVMILGIQYSDYASVPVSQSRVTPRKRPAPAVTKGRTHVRP